MQKVMMMMMFITISHCNVKVRGTSMEEMRGASVAGSSPQKVQPAGVDGALPCGAAAADELPNAVLKYCCCFL
jgi:hypothetical protein